MFVGLGAGASVFGQFIQTYKYELSMVAGVVIILFGLHFVGLLRIPLLYTEKRYHTEMSGASFLGAYVIGLAFAFGWTPCIGPILAAVLTLAASEGSLGVGVRMLFVYSLGLGIPFILAAVAIRPFMGFMQRFRRHLGTVEKVMGVFLILTGIAFLNVFEWFSIASIGQWLIEHVPFLSQIEEWRRRRACSRRSFSAAQDGRNGTKTRRQTRYHYGPDRADDCRVGQLRRRRHPGRLEDVHRVGRLRRQRADGTYRAEHTGRPGRGAGRAVVRRDADSLCPERPQRRRGEDRDARDRAGHSGP